MPFTYYAIGSTLAGMVNIESTYGLTIHQLPGNLVPLVGKNRKRAASGNVRRSGAIDGALLLDVASRSNLNAFINAVFGGWNSASAQMYLSVLTTDGHYTSIRAYVEPPAFEAVNAANLKTIELPITGIAVQKLSKSANYTVTTADHMIEVDTTSGSVTLALPALSGVAQNVPYSFIKTVAANSLVLDGNSSETVDGASTKTLTAQYARVDLVYDGTQWVTI